MTPPPVLKATMFGRMPVGGQKQKGGAPAPSGPKGVRVEHRIGIQAPAEVIWDIVYDIENWSAWNPLNPEAGGAIHIGQTISITVALPGMKARPTRPTVLEWVPNEQLHWQTSLLGGLVKGTRYVEIERLAPESCIVSNGEIIGGLLGPTAARNIGARLFRGLREMNEALKTRAEQRWRERAA
jgi:hypothetical protein